MEKFYITTSIPYVNAPPHIGFALEMIQADVIARHHQLKGEDVFFLTGTDEHGIKIAKAAKDNGISPQEFTDQISGRFQDLTSALHVSNTDFIRTTDRKRHWPSVKEVWQKLKAKSTIYKKPYQGFYCVGCEAFILEKDLVDGYCPAHKRKPELVKEENYFFRLSEYAKEITGILENGKLRIIPQNRANEILGLIREGLEDVSFSRPRKTLQWGIPVPDDETQTIYVWADALVNYISVLGYPAGPPFQKYWPADVHVVGKDILRFHALIWPAMLLALGLELPKTIFVHGFITVEGQKMSKSLGNVIDPFVLVEKYGADAVRYFFLREISPTEDGDFTEGKFIERYNADLAGGLGNLVARTLALAKDVREIGNAEFGLLGDAKRNVDGALNLFEFRGALEEIWEIVHRCDEYIDREKPWEGRDNVKKVIANVLFAVCSIGELLKPFLPETSEKIRVQLSGRARVPLFPRIEI